MTAIFSQRKLKLVPRQCFVIMPFDHALKNVYNTIESLVRDYCGLTCVRADEISHSVRITNDIWMGINQSRFLIADLTGHNPNVFYELGIAHALNKPVILLTQTTDDVPFDLMEIRYLPYDPNDLQNLRRGLLGYIRRYISTIPNDWDSNFYPNKWDGSYLKITELEVPQVVTLGQPFEIVLKVRNNEKKIEQDDDSSDTGDVGGSGVGHGLGGVGRNARQGYFSVSFPDGVDALDVIKSNAQVKLGKKGDLWAGEKYALKYPIAEGFKDNGLWQSGWSYYINIKGYAKRKGLLWFYVNACCEDDTTGKWIWDPVKPLLDVDQRGEHVYCGVIEVT